jgi:hypothetical protein
VLRWLIIRAAARAVLDAPAPPAPAPPGVQIVRANSRNPVAFAAAVRALKR